MEHILKLDYIKKNWEPQVGSKEAELTVWDVASVGYKDRKIPDKISNPSLRLVTEKGMWNQDSEILDVGCGAGIYSVAFAKECKRVVGTDVSGGMIQAAKENAVRYGVPNTEFHQIDWHDFELETKGWEKQFDLVFANMTPAVQSYHTLELMNRASRGWCYISKPTAWKYAVIYELLQMLGIWEDYRTFDIDMLCAYDVLRLQGRFPYVDYTSDVWVNDRELNDACENYIQRIEMKKLLNAEQKQKIREYLEKKAVDGKIHDETEVTISMLYWKV